MKATFTTTVMKDGEKNATGIQVPPETMAALNAGKKPAVRITLNDYSYQSTVAVMGEAFMIPLSQEHRAAAGIKPGDSVEVTLELDTEPRTVTVPADLATALSAVPGATEAFAKLAFSHRKEHVRSVEDAKTPATRERRIAAVVSKISGS